MLIEARGITKIFRRRGFFRSGDAADGTRALDGVTLSLEPGSITGLAGANGSGKTTLLRVLAGRLLPDSGTILLDDRPAGGAELRSAGALAEAGGAGFYSRLTARENIEFFGALSGLSRAEMEERCAALPVRLGLRETDLDKRFDALSEGAARKISLLRAFARRPRLLLLDEPANGLDARSAAAFSSLLKEPAVRGRAAVLYVCHDPAELARSCGRVLILREGRIAAELNGPAEKDIAEACGGAT